MEIQDTILENGLRVITCEKPVANTTFGAVFINDHESLQKKPGIRHLLEHMIYIGGSKKYPSKQAINKAYEINGVDHNAITYFTMSEYYIEARKENFYKGLEVLLEAVAQPLFSDTSFKNERMVINEELKGKIDNIQELSFFESYRFFWDKESAYYENLFEELKSNSSLELKDIKDFYNSYYIPENMVVVASGDINHQKIVALSKMHIKKKEGKIVDLNKVSNFLNNDQLNLYHQKSKEAYITFSFKAPGINDGDETKALILRYLLDNEIFALRELLPAYHIDCRYRTLKKDGYLMLEVTITPSKFLYATEKVLSIFTSNREAIGKDSFKMAKEMAAFSTSQRSDNNANIAFEIAVQTLAGKTIKGFKEKTEEVLNISYDEMQNFLKEFISKDNLRISIIGPFSEKDKKEAEKIFNESDL